MNENLHTSEAIDSGITLDPETSTETVAARPLASRIAERGASLVEYALLLALIAVVCVAAVGALGDSTTKPYSELTESGFS